MEMFIVEYNEKIMERIDVGLLMVRLVLVANLQKRFYQTITYSYDFIKFYNIHFFFHLYLIYLNFDYNLLKYLLHI
jgi:hypothetical protein